MAAPMPIREVHTSRGLCRRVLRDSLHTPIQESRLNSHKWKTYPRRQNRTLHPSPGGAVVCTCGSAFAHREAADRQEPADDDIRHRETSTELLARTTQELEELRAENSKLRKRESEHGSKKVRKRYKKACTHSVAVAKGFARQARTPRLQMLWVTG